MCSVHISMHLFGVYNIHVHVRRRFPRLIIASVLLLGKSRMNLIWQKYMTAFELAHVSNQEKANNHSNNEGLISPAIIQCSIYPIRHITCKTNSCVEHIEFYSIQFIVWILLTFAAVDSQQFWSGVLRALCHTISSYLSSSFTTLQYVYKTVQIIKVLNWASKFS